MPVRRRLFPKLTYRDRMRKSLFDLELQLGQARTEAERDRLNQKILDLQTRQGEYEAKLAMSNRKRKATLLRKKKYGDRPWQEKW
jgi:hypothetical protein